MKAHVLDNDKSVTVRYLKLSCCNFWFDSFNVFISSCNSFTSLPRSPFNFSSASLYFLLQKSLQFLVAPSIPHHMRALLSLSSPILEISLPSTFHCYIYCDKTWVVIRRKRLYIMKTQKLWEALEPTLLAVKIIWTLLDSPFRMHRSLWRLLTFFNFSRIARLSSDLLESLLM